ncbi:family 20 glycosylhydrolase [Arcticibacterium luteifluviistationis]|uniref:beta-N-acetylhexosaminidase n=1 Tax=Arcticibacterium luteifluviistationis TaxID=1784714 RepID=A0A2Z4GBY5_9BACT|nr:family 20 glycosylhydrolase [Arcticibacterium luteifluviistationis]AWV98802.1 glycoside hydrolase family 20 [Arcticibacterium luteifluviistationis]
MKKHLWYSILIFSVIFASCKPIKKTGDFKILPLPQEFEITGVSSLGHDSIKKVYSSSETEMPILSKVLGELVITKEVPEAQIVYDIDNTLDLGENGYLLTISENKIQIKAKDEAGLFYAFKTLDQLVIDAYEQKVNLPICTIKDYPLISYRAVHLDVKHHRETLDYYYNLIDKLASYKVNAIIAEVEDKLQYQSQPTVSSAGALSSEEWKTLSKYALERHIKISPLIQGLGHASFILKHDKYKHLRDDPESDWAFNPLNPKTYDLQFDLYKDALAAFPDGKYLHIGGDEVHTTGRNSGKTSLELQLIWLQKVCKFAEENNRIPIFWDDMPLKDSGVYESMFDSKLSQEEVDKIWKENEHKLLAFLDQLPKNCIYMRWNYSNSDALGNSKAMKWFLDHDLQVMGATAGQTRWVLMPQEESNMNNIRSFVNASIDNNLNSIFLTLWDDDSPHFELYMRGILAFAEYSWAGDKRTKEEIKTIYRQREFSHELSAPKYAFIDDLEVQVALWKNILLKGNKRNYLKKMEKPLEEGLISLPDLSNKGKWTSENEERLEAVEKIMISYEQVADQIDEMKEKTERNLYTLEVYEQVNELVAFSAKALLALKELDNSNNEQGSLSKVKNLEADFKKIRNELETVYSKTRILNKPADYILDQDHHAHLANQSINFDWQFNAEMLLFEKIKKTY